MENRDAGRPITRRSSHGAKGNAMIQQVITCDVCGSEKRQTNHWFVVYEESGELRTSGWMSPHLLYPGTKHLCGETCLHKLVGKFLTRLVDLDAQHKADNGETLVPASSDVTAVEDCIESVVAGGLLSSPAPTSQRSVRHEPRELESLPRWRRCAGGRMS